MKRMVYGLNEFTDTFSGNYQCRRLINPESSNLKGESLINFVLNDFLGLGIDERIKSRTIKSLHEKQETSKSLTSLYQKAEEYLSWIFDMPILLFPQSSMMHKEFLPLVIEKTDAIILNGHVNLNLGIAVDYLKKAGNYVEVLLHNQVEVLETRIIQLASKHSKVWFLAESIYSDFGEILRWKGIDKLMHVHSNFKVYIDDSKGMSWVGENGRGFINTYCRSNHQVIVSSSLCKGFGTEGGIIICTDQAMKEQLSKRIACLVFNSKVEPVSLRAIIESAKIHLSNEIYERQSELNERISFSNIICEELGLPKISSSLIPQAFFITGKTEISQEICFNLMDKGYYINVVNYPASDTEAGIKVNISLRQTKNDIKNMLKSLKMEYDRVLKKRSMTVNELLVNHKKNSIKLNMVLSSNYFYY